MDKKIEMKCTVLSAIISSSLARIPTHPMDTCKSKLQVMINSVEKNSLINVLRNTYKMEGIKGLYKGFGVVFLGSAPAGCLYWSSYELSKSLITIPKKFKYASHFISGFIAEAFSCILWVPIDLLKERMQVQSSVKTIPKHLQYKNGFDAMIQICKSEGIIGIYRGYGATLISFGPFSAFYLMFYEVFKEFGNRKLGYQNSPIFLVSLNGFTAGILASLITNPLDLVKLRLQVQRREKYFKFHYKNILHGIYELIRYGGIVEMFRGGFARALHVGPTTAIHIVLYEKIKEFFIQRQSI